MASKKKLQSLYRGFVRVVLRGLFGICGFTRRSRRYFEPGGLPLYGGTSFGQPQVVIGLSIPHNNFIISFQSRGQIA
jgi:hypothetical protein